jgi:CDP-diacylglycerol--serine O-phosphatidyltransferase
LCYYCATASDNFILKTQIPNIITLANMAAGLLALLSVFSGDLKMAAYFFAASLIFDFADGLVARALKVHSELGKQLDSLADVVSFGVVPGFVLFKMFGLAQEVGSEPVPDFLPYLAFLVPLFSALRLGKFNLDDRQDEYFIGLPTPANALLIYSLALWAAYTTNPTTQGILLHPFFLSFLSVASALLLVAELPLMSLKLKDFTWKKNRGRIVLAAAAVLLIAVLRLRALAFIVPLYLLLSIFFKPNK